MKAYIRTDSSNLIGSGHVMRCLTLAQALSTKGVQVRFISRKHPGNMNQFIQREGFEVLELAERDKNAEFKGYATWLGCSEIEDAQESTKLIRQQTSKADLLIVDHYGLGQNFTQQLKPYFRHRMVIDDLANRKQECETLLNQNLLPDQDKTYLEQINHGCKLLLGPQYALLREEFYQHQRVANPNRLLVFFGGSDPWELTLKTLEVLQSWSRQGINYPATDIVVGENYPHQQHAAAEVKKLKEVKLHIQTSKMAQLMSEAKLMLGAGGSSHWERCILGLPSIIITVAENQIASTQHLATLGACEYLGDATKITKEQLARHLQGLLNDTEKLNSISNNASLLVSKDGGAKYIAQYLMNQLKKTFF